MTRQSQPGLFTSPRDALHATASPSERALTKRLERKRIIEFEASRDEQPSHRPPAPPVVLDHPVLGRVSFETKHLRRPFWGANVRLVESGCIRVEISHFERLPTIQTLDTVARNLFQLDALARHGRHLLANDDDAREHVRSFKRSVFEALDAPALHRRFGVDNLEQLTDARFIESLQFVKVVFLNEPEHSEDPTIIFYYSLDGDLPIAIDVMLWMFGGHKYTTFSVQTWGPLRPPQTTVTIEHAILGRLEFDANGFATTALTLGSKTVKAEVRCPGTPGAEQLDKPARLLADLVEFDWRARRAMTYWLALGECAAVSQYKSHHVEQLRGYAIDDETFFVILEIVRVGIEVGTSGSTVECDYSIGKESTHHVLRVRFDFDGELRGIEVEAEV